MASAKTTSVQTLMTKAQQALSRNHWFEAERLAAKALDMARAEGDFHLMARIVLPLLEARRQRMQIALDSKKVVILDAPPPADMELKPVCYLVQPPLVGADARRLRLLALEREVPALVLCREPKTQLGLCPIVAIGQVTIRARIDAPKNWDKPTPAWFAEAGEQLGDAAIESIDPTADSARQVDALLERLDALPDHEKLHQALEETCQIAAKAYAGATPPPRTPSRSRVATTSDAAPDESDA